MGSNNTVWIEALKNNDVETLWAKLFNLISKHSSVRLLYPPNEFSSEMVRDNYCDLTQYLFVKLFEKERWKYYLDNDYSDERIQQELYRIEVPNMITLLQRERHPESYRIARRIMDVSDKRPTPLENLLHKEKLLQSWLRVLKEQVRNKPPKSAEYLLYLFLPKKDRDPLLGDLEEDYRRIIVKFGLRRAKLWYYAQVTSSLLPLFINLIKKVVKWGVLGWVGDWLRRFIS